MSFLTVYGVRLPVARGTFSMRARDIGGKNSTRRRVMKTARFTTGPLDDQTAEAFKTIFSNSGGDSFPFHPFSFFSNNGACLENNPANGGFTFLGPVLGSGKRFVQFASEYRFKTRLDLSEWTMFFKRGLIQEAKTSSGLFFGTNYPTPRVDDGDLVFDGNPNSFGDVLIFPRAFPQTLVDEISSFGITNRLAGFPALPIAGERLGREVRAVPDVNVTRKTILDGSRELYQLTLAFSFTEKG